MPDFAMDGDFEVQPDEAIRQAITTFHETVLDVVASLVPAVKLQIAFYEQYGLAGLGAFYDTIRAAKERGLLVIVDAKRSDISSTAEAYANAFLGTTRLRSSSYKAFDVDCMTVNPYLGRDSLEPFVSACAKYGKGIFVLVKTSNQGSTDLQDQRLAATGTVLYDVVARMVDELGKGVLGESGYSSIGAVVGATFPHEAERLRTIMQQAILLVPGYGAQGGTGRDAAASFNSDRLGAVVNASRSITYSYGARDISIGAFQSTVRAKMSQMIDDINTSLTERFSDGEECSHNRGSRGHRV
jgi:orotidine-5'-phosphate decarboxylase